MACHILTGDALTVLRTLDSETIDCCITSPPYYGLRDYGIDRQLGVEPTPELFIEALTSVFQEVKRVLRPEGTLWVNCGDSYCSGNRTSYDQTSDNIGSRGTPIIRPRQAPGCKPKDLIGIPWMLAFALRKNGWYLRSDIIWHKPNVKPESVKDRPTKAHEYVFLLSKSLKYYFNAPAIAEPCSNGTGTRHIRSVWSISTQACREAHFATFPLLLPERCVLAGCPPNGIVLDPFAGAGTTGLAALKHGRQFVGIELHPEYVSLADKRLQRETGGPWMEVRP